jgi:hypothetical protein
VDFEEVQATLIESSVCDKHIDEAAFYFAGSTLCGGVHATTFTSATWQGLLDAADQHPVQRFEVAIGVVEPRLSQKVQYSFRRHIPGVAAIGDLGSRGAVVAGEQKELVYLSFDFGRAPINTGSVCLA